MCRARYFCVFSIVIERRLVKSHQIIKMKHSIALNSQQHIEHLTEQKLIACKEYRHAIWLDQIQKHFQNAQHRWKKSVAVQLVIAVQLWFNVISSSNDFNVSHFVNKIVLELLVYDDDLRCQIALDQCHYVYRSVKSMRKHCQRSHDWAK